MKSTRPLLAAGITRLLAVGAFAFTLSGYTTELRAQDSGFVRADIYYFGWSILTRSTLKPDDVRRGARTVTHIVDDYETETFAKWLKLPSGNAEPPQAGDPRLVIDFWDARGTRTTYYADVFRLYAEDGHASREIDEAFLQRFTFGPVWPRR